MSATGDTTIQQGVLSSIQQSTVQVTPNGRGNFPTVTAVQTGYDGTSVVNNISGSWVTGKTLGAGVQTVRSYNHKDIQLGKQGVQNNAITHPITSTGQTLDPQTGTVLNSSTTTVPFPPSH